jgi:GntR family transcriptional regulator, negative regulator for fad regulon and positive regulator of fabA
MTTYQSESKDNVSWQPIQKPAKIAEERLIEAILDGTFSINSHLPGERELSESLGVTRPTLREALQRLARDGWLEIHQGKPTRVQDYWTEGKLGVLNTLSEHPDHLPDDFIPNLLQVRLAMAPMYTASAVSNAPGKVVQILEGRKELNDSPKSFTNFDWTLQHNLVLLSENPVFIMILNGFEDLFLNLAPFYFAIPEARQHSQQYYIDLSEAAKNKDIYRAKILTEDIMRESLSFWQQTKLL